MDMRKILAEDRFAQSLNFRLVSYSEGECVLAVDLDERHMNAMGVAQGGMLFALADTAFGIAVNAAGRDTVSLSSSISYLRPAPGGTLTAHAATVSRGRTTCCVDVLITDDAGRPVAKAQFMGYSKQE